VDKLAGWACLQHTHVWHERWDDKMKKKGNNNSNWQPTIDKVSTSKLPTESL